MSDFIDRLALKERAEEDIYFAKRDRELITALRRSAQVSAARSNRGNRANRNRPVQRNGNTVTLGSFIRNLCRLCRYLVSAYARRKRK
jgi:hypothetical protein